MSITYEPYVNAECPRCGYTECRDDGPYEPGPIEAAGILPPVDPSVHLLWCGRCGKPFDAAPPEAHERQRAWTAAQHEAGRHQCCDPAGCPAAAEMAARRRR